MFEFLTDPWIIGIGGGIISGFVVFFVTSYIFSKRDNQAYIRNLHEAKMEVLYAIRPSISEENFPNREVLDSLITATMSKYGIEKKDYYTFEELAGDLIKEVMDSSFISAKVKKIYCEELIKIKNQVTPESIPPERIPQEPNIPIETTDSKVYSFNDKQRTLTAFSLLLGILGAIMTVMITLTNSVLFPDGTRSTFIILIPTLMILVLVTITSFFSTRSVFSARLIQKYRERFEENEKEADE